MDENERDSGKACGSHSKTDITIVPAYFSDLKTRAIKDASQLSGLNLL